MKLGIQPFWFWNGIMDKKEIVRQILEMHDQGIKGFIIHPRQGMELPYMSEAYFERIDLAVEQAKKLDMEVWLYDEYPYPSGVTAGQVTLDHPEYQCKMLDKKEYLAESGETVVMDMPWGQVLSAKAYPAADGETDWEHGIDLSEYIGTAYQEEVFQFSGLTEYNHKRYFTGQQARRLWWTAPEGNWQIYVFTEVVMTGFKYFNTYVDTMNPKAIRHFLETTHERYRKRFGVEFGKTIKGIFTDEITAFPPERPWSPLLPGMIKERTGIDIVEYLPVLFDIPMGDMTDRVLYAYWNTCTDAFIESYDKQVYEWCCKYGVRFIGEKPILRSKELEFAHCPGIDAGHQKVGAKPAMAPGKYRANGKMISSAEHFYGRDAALCEAFHSIGWGMTLQDMKWIFDWLTVHGVDWFVIHAYYYTTNGLKKHDAPPSAFYQMPWWKDMKLLSEYADRLIHTSRSCKRNVPVLLVDPVTSVWTAREEEKEPLREEFSRLQRSLLEHRLDYYIIDPQLLEKGLVKKGENGTVISINGEEFSLIVLPSMTNLEDHCYLKVREYAEAGGMLGAEGCLADRRILKEDPGPWMKEWFSSGRDTAFYGESPDELCRKLKKAVGGYLLEPADGLGIEDILSVEYEEADGNRLYFIVNSSDRERLISGNIIRGTWKMEPLQSGYYRLDEDGYLKVPQRADVSWEISLDQEWKMELKSQNALRLGWWELKACKTGQESAGLIEPMPVIDQLEKGRMMIPLEPRKQFGCPKTLLLTEDTYCYQTRFEVADESVLSLPVDLVMEPYGIQGDWKISLNGYELKKEDFRTKSLFLPDNQAADITGYLKKGTNEIMITTAAAKTYDGLNSPLYLMGSFGVELENQVSRLVKLPDWGCMKDGRRDKIPHYAGTAAYSCSMDLKLPAPGQSVEFVINDTWLQDSVTLMVNGCCLGTKAWSSYRWDIPCCILKNGQNEICLELSGSMIGLFEGQYFNKETHRYENYQGEETVIEEYEAVVHK